jgi:hypothetical protein
MIMFIYCVRVYKYICECVSDVLECTWHKTYFLSGLYCVRIKDIGVEVE